MSAKKYPSEAARKKAYQDRQKAKRLLGIDQEGQSAAIPEPQPVAPSPAVEAAVATGSKAVLIAVRDDPNALNADRIRAAVEVRRIENEEEQKAGGEQYAGLIHLKSVLDTMPIEDRLAYCDKHLNIIDEAPEAQREETT
jgi:hypothetical protein